ncbi:threonine--tRNA ligase [uncultured Allofournierella sp.]|uniref:threonine--tRNA ligase n=1 Tax=uncultured Allofournierella sp. TaxID=1940258 RepID=UPI0025DD431D|nr:threonine--tRNA ligase [uncultured Fournierella sp.]
MIKVDLKGTVKEFEAGVSAAEVAKSIGMGLYKSACAAKVDGQVCDLRTVLDKDCALEILTFADDEGKHAFWHTAAHVMAQAIQHLYPEAHFGIGPALESGWYYDIGGVKPFTPDQFAAIEAEMKKIAKADLPVEKRIITVEEGRDIFAGQPYKLELLEEYAEKGWELSVYQQGDFVDLCAGPHLMSTGAVKAVKLTQATSAYWRGDSSRDSLCRMYGIAFPKASELEEYLKQQEEALKRDHNKIGRELEYFTTVEAIGQGLPVMLPNGARAIQLLQRWVEDTEQKRGYLLTKTPLMAKRDLYKISGHWDHYLDGMFVLGDPYDETKECFALRPMTCPFQYQVYLNRKRSYRDLPMRLGETSTLFRNEDSGEMHGLIRVRQFTISEGHIVLRPDQLEEEFRGCLELAKEMLETLGLGEDVSYRFSQWDPNRKDKYEGTAEQWEEAQGLMKKILDHLGLEYKVGIDEAAFYGPKLDIQIKNVFGKEDTLITIQIDMLLAQKFGMTYVGEDGQEHTPYIIHRTSIGCYERTLALLLEKYAGALPTWLMPTQVEIIPITERQHAYARELHSKLEAAGIRVDTDYRSEKMGYKIREAQLKKIPYMLVVGDKEMEEGLVAVRARKEEKGGVMTADAFIGQILTEIATKER